MKINQKADLTILLQYGWNNEYRDCYYKIFKGNGLAEISLVVNPVGVNLDFIINSITNNYSEYDESNVDIFEIIVEIELLKKLNILIK